MSATRKQSGVIPYRHTDAGTEVLLITSTRTGHWQFPKGMLEPGLSSRESAEQEAFEEAGAIGFAHDTVVARYAYNKSGFLRCTVDLFPMHVQQVVADHDWQELHLRRRRWASLDEARLLIDSPAIRRCLEDFRRWRAQGGVSSL